ncbi:MAG: collagen-like protein [Bacteroidales bacterium]|nr:collagen-like protein [Candidatus Scybalousia scybalohippi]
MLKFGNKEFRGLEEQVEKNKNDIQDIKELNIFINGLGIKVLGTLGSQEEIPEDEYQYGDAWLIGTEEPYELYVYTRAEYGSEWVNLGPLAIRGPQGIQGEKGDKGDTGTNVKWFVSTVQPPAVTYGNCWLNSSTGDLYFCGYASDGVTLRWNYNGNIKGPQGLQGVTGPQGPQGLQGPQGEKGETGDVGGFINIHGIVASTSLLPSPTSLHDLTAAYLVGTAKPYTLYLQVGSTSAEAVWTDMGPLNVATYVTVNGQFQNTWEANTKVDTKSNSSYQYAQVYAVGRAPQNTAEIIPAVDTTINNSIVRRDSNGNFSVKAPTSDYQPANKKYVDDAVAAAGGGGGGTKLYRHKVIDADDDYYNIITTRSEPYKLYVGNFIDDQVCKDMGVVCAGSTGSAFELRDMGPIVRNFSKIGLNEYSAYYVYRSTQGAVSFMPIYHEIAVTDVVTEYTE